MAYIYNIYSTDKKLIRTWGWFCYWNLISYCCHCSVVKSCLTLRPHGLQNNRLPCPSLSPGDCPNSHPLRQWCYLIILSSAVLFSFCLQSFPASECFPMSWPFIWRGQSVGASASASVLPGNIQSWFPFVGLLSGWSTGKFWTQWHSALKT